MDPAEIMTASQEHGGLGRGYSRAWSKEVEKEVRLRFFVDKQGCWNRGAAKALAPPAVVEGEVKGRDA